VLSELRHATESVHRQLEARLDLLSPDLTARRYAAVLTAFHAVWAPLEPRLRHGWTRLGLDPEPRRRAHLIERDLAALGIRADQIPAARRLPRVADSAAAVGALYVLEGSTLGGQVIARALGARGDLPFERAGAFLRGRGRETGPLWHQFGHALSRLPWSADDRRAASGAARRTFGALAAQAREHGAFAVSSGAS